jgi:hypothetical protein
MDVNSIRSFQLLHKCVMGAIGFAVLPLHGIVGQCVVFCMFSLMKDWIGMDLASKGMFGIIGTGLLLFWVGFLETGGRFIKISKSSIGVWKKEGKKMSNKSKYERKCVGKFCKSCKPLGIGLEGVIV